VIRILVSAGDEVALESAGDLESDKATMDVPASVRPATSRRSTSQSSDLVKHGQPPVTDDMTAGDGSAVAAGRLQ